MQAMQLDSIKLKNQPAARFVTSKHVKTARNIDI